MARIHRRVSLAALWLGLACGVSPAGDTRFTPPPGEETPEIKELIDRADGAFRSGGTVSRVLTDPAFMPARAWPRFRELVRENAAVGVITLVAASEPGDRLVVRGTVLDVAGQPARGALLYVYHTSAQGWYSDQGAHISGNSGDVAHARLFAYLRTDAEGHYELHTIRPAGYPGTDLPAHIHVYIDAAGDRPRSHGTEIRFEDDPRLTPEWRERSREEGSLICPVKYEADRTQSVVADFTLR